MKHSLWRAIYEDDSLDDPALASEPAPYDYDPNEEAPVECPAEMYQRTFDEEAWRIGEGEFEHHFHGVVRSERAEPNPRFL